MSHLWRAFRGRSLVRSTTTGYQTINSSWRYQKQIVPMIGGWWLWVQATVVFRWGRDQWVALVAILVGVALIGFGLVPWWIGGLISGAILVASWVISPSLRRSRH
jgi:hypothetical protein